MLMGNICYKCTMYCFLPSKDILLLKSKMSLKLLVHVVFILKLFEIKQYNVIFDEKPI